MPCRHLAFLLLALLPLAAAEPAPAANASAELLWEQGDTVAFMSDVGVVAGTQHFITRAFDQIRAANPTMELKLLSTWAGEAEAISTYVSDYVLPLRPAVTVLFTGTRSAQVPAAQAPNAATFEKALREAIEKLQAAGSEVVVLGTSVVSDTPETKTPGNELAETYSRICAEVARATNVGYLDLRGPCLEYLQAHPATDGKPALFIGDFTFTPAWHELAAARIATAVAERMAVAAMRIELQDAPFLERTLVELPVRRVRKGATVEIRYTLDGKDPTATSKKYEKPILITGSAAITLKVLASDGTRTATAKAVFTKTKGKPGEAVSRRELGLEWGLYQGKWEFLPEFTSLIPSVTGVWPAPELAAYRKVEAYAAMTEKVGLRFVGYLDVPVEGAYTLETISDDGSRLWLDDELVVDNDGGHGMRIRSGRVALREGLHRVRLDYFQGTGSSGLEVWWTSDAGIRRSRVPDSAWLHNPAKPHEWSPPVKKDDPKKK
jgi:hypothetical protein